MPDEPPDVQEFKDAVNTFRAESGNRFPTVGQILQILLDLGYGRPEAGEEAMLPDPPTEAPPDEEPIMDRRFGDRRSGRDRRQDAAEAPAADSGGDGSRRRGRDRRSSDRRRDAGKQRNINSYDMKPAAREFADSIQRYKARAAGRFPSAAEVLGIVKSLGYRRSS